MKRFVNEKDLVPNQTYYTDKDRRILGNFKFIKISTNHILNFKLIYLIHEKTGYEITFLHKPNRMWYKTTFKFGK